MPPEPTPGLGEIAYDLTLQRSRATLPRTTTISQLFYFSVINMESQTPRKPSRRLLVRFNVHICNILSHT